MKHKFFAIPARNPEAAETELDSFCSQHRVTFVEKQLVMDGAQSFWSVCVTYQTGSTSISGSKEQRKPKVDYKKLLNAHDFSVYLELHALRKDFATRQNPPPYAVFSNDQLVEMVKLRVKTKAELKAIDNIGKTRLESYGEAFLQKLNECLNSFRGEGRIFIRFAGKPATKTRAAGCASNVSGYCVNARRLAVF